jgi:hypothetical protein
MHLIPIRPKLSPASAVGSTLHHGPPSLCFQLLERINLTTNAGKLRCSQVESPRLSEPYERRLFPYLLCTDYTLNRPVLADQRHSCGWRISRYAATGSI